MKKYNLLFIIIAFISLFWFGCKPDDLTSKSLGSGVDSSLLIITITPVADQFHFKVTGTVPAGTGLTTMMNGKKAMVSGDTLYFPIPGAHSIELRYFTQLGGTTKHSVITTTLTDDSYFSDPMYKLLTGGSVALSGKDWQLDSLSTAHLGCGPTQDDPTSWWKINPLGKSSVKVMYDDVFNINLNSLVITYTNHGSSYANAGNKDNAAFSNQKLNDADYTVDFVTKPGSWEIDKRKDGNYLVITPSTTPIFPCYWVAAIDNTYKIVSLTADHMTLVAQATASTATFWQYILIRKGYVEPRVTGTFTNKAGTGTGNMEEITLNLTNPATTFTISSVKIKFGDNTKDSTITTGLGSETTSIVINHRYMLKGTYTPTATVVNSKETISLSGTAVTFAANDPSYVPPVQNYDATTTYNDFDGEKIVSMLFTSAGGIDGTNATGAIVSNPNASFGPNRSSNVYKFMKTGTKYGNNYMDLPNGGRFDFTYQSTFTYLVYGTAGNSITFKLQNTDLGGNSFTTATADQVYVIKNSNMWEQVTVSFKGVAGNKETDITTGATTQKGYYNEMCWLIQPNDAGGPYTYYIDKITGPVVVDMKK